MELNLLFVLNSLFLGVGLAMDAFSVSLANGLNEPGMSKKKMCVIAGIFSLFQWLMPLIGWICVHTIIQLFASFEKCIPWIALLLLLFIGGKMILEGIGDKEEDPENSRIGITALIIQGIATSIDALSVGFTIAEYSLIMAMISAIIIGVVTFIICFSGLIIGKRFGAALSGKASVLGGIILIGIGIEIFLRAL